MRNIIFLDGPNFSGRSKLLGQWLISERGAGKPVTFIGPSIASVLTGLANTVSSELDLYTAWNALPPASKLQAYFERKQQQILASLSGGEQVLLALAGIRPAVRVAIDCALEQLDDSWRTWTLAYLRDASWDGVVQLADNQMSSAAEPYCDVVRMPSGSSEYRVQQLGTFPPQYRSAVENGSIVVEGLSFRYPKGPLVFHNSSFHLKAGNVYRLRGSNGAGKSTLVRLLSGVLPFQSGSMFVNGRLYEPYRDGNRLIALAMQNPDEQWTDINIAADLKRRLGNVKPLWKLPAHDLDDLLKKWESSIGVTGLSRRHVLDFPVSYESDFRGFGRLVDICRGLCSMSRRSGRITKPLHSSPMPFASVRLKAMGLSTSLTTSACHV